MASNTETSAGKIRLGVKGLVDSGITNIPPAFIQNQTNAYHEFPSSGSHTFSIPTINLDGINGPSRVLRIEIVDQVREACKNWGFFQVVNHGIPLSLMDAMADGIRKFHEQEDDVKKEFYSADGSKTVAYYSNFDMSRDNPAAAFWKDILRIVMAPHPPNPQDLPDVCRDVVIDYSSRVTTLALTLLELMSEGLGLNPNHLREMGCADGHFLLGHYYPPCPQPELVVGTVSHADTSFITVLLQDQIGGLQVLHQNQWVDVAPIPGAFVVNVGDMLQLVTNDTFVSVEHRVLVKSVGPRISVAGFYRNHLPPENASRPYGPIKELVSAEKPPIYKETTIKDFVSYSTSKKRDGISAQSCEHWLLYYDPSIVKFLEDRIIVP